MFIARRRKMFAELVRRARSFRRFDESSPIPFAAIRELVDIARLVPSGGNRQPLRYKIVSGAEECGKMFPLLAWAGALKDWPGPAAGERPTGYVVICTEKGVGLCEEIDLGIAAQTIQLAATQLGYAACQLGSVQRQQLRELFRIDEKYEIRLVIALGRPGETVVLDELPADGKTDYWRASDNVHHVPKRKLADVLL
jgi:nitroreductase